ncbi:MAG: YsnF/AvaK domain-containing protein, partial [Gemmatimonadaceae bacterium]|nr:YsnF/AvaK domain-containing protein [Gemmatimonadaceae bacterium]
YTREDDERYAAEHESDGTVATTLPFDTLRPAVQLGHLAGRNPDYRGRSFDDVEPALRAAWAAIGRQDWDVVRNAASRAHAWARHDDVARVTRAEEELVIGTRRVQVGEVTVRKTVEVERFRDIVSLLFEDVTIERRLVTDPTASREIQISDDEIRIPLLGEEPVIETRIVASEEVIVRTAVVTEQATVEADLRTERVDHHGPGDATPAMPPALRPPHAP